MNIPEICITFIAGILGVAYPILLEVVSRLDEKYSSLVVVDLFKKEKEYTTFRIFLNSSLILVLLYIIFNLPFIPVWTTFGVIAPILVVLMVISTTTLIIIFLLFVKKVLIYYSTYQVLQYLNQKKETEDHSYFQATFDILHLSIKKQDTVAAKTASEYIYKNFRNFRVASVGTAVLYPDIYYQMTYKTIQELIFSKDERFAYLEHRSIGGIWFLGEHEKAEINEITFSWMWRSLVLSVRYERDDMFMEYWGVAHQHFISELTRVQEDRVRDGEAFRVENGKEVAKRDAERDRFLEFNYGLGGLLLYRSRFDVIKRMFSYTTSVPYSYDLLPLWMDQVFQLYFKFRDPYEYNFPFIHNRYYFPDAEGINGEGVVRNWITRYAALLFIRQYSIIPHLSFMEPLRYPNIPEKQGEKRLWIDNLDYFKQLVSEILGNRELMKGVGLGYMDDDWFASHDKIEPRTFIDNLKASVIQEFENTEQNQPISDAKKQAFFDTSKNVIETSLKPYTEIFNNDIQGETKSWFVSGMKMVAEKSAFSDNPDVHHTNFDSFLSYRVSEGFQKAISETFHMKSPKSYLVRGLDFYKAIDKLPADPSEHIIVNFGIDLNYDISYTKVPGLTEKRYKGMDIFSFDKYNRGLMNATFFILRKKDLPELILKQIDQEATDKYTLQIIDENGFIRASVIDLNANEQIKQEVEAEGNHTNLNKSVLMYIAMNIEIRWKKEIKIVELERYSEFNNRGVPIELADIKFE